MRSWLRYFDDCLSLFYPRLCLACGKNLLAKQEAICVSCQYHLPKTHFHLQKENPFTDRFWGRISLEAGAALYYFSKGGRTQTLIHHLKYLGKYQVGLKLGQLYGRMLLESDHFKDVDLIVPVPLHPRKKKLRGYNQSDFFAKGLAETMARPWYPHALRRELMTSTQTQKSRMERFDNVGKAFEIGEASLMAGKHVLLVDDVLTTGATLEACAEKILQLPDTRLSLVTIAIAG